MLWDLPSDIWRTNHGSFSSHPNPTSRFRSLKLPEPRKSIDERRNVLYFGPRGGGRHGSLPSAGWLNATAVSASNETCWSAHCPSTRPSHPRNANTCLPSPALSRMERPKKSSWEIGKAAKPAAPWSRYGEAWVTDAENSRIFLCYEMLRTVRSTPYLYL
jgi:hypothetical protein